MTPEDQQHLDEHVQAIAKILYANADNNPPDKSGGH